MSKLLTPNGMKFAANEATGNKDTGLSTSSKPYFRSASGKIRPFHCSRSASRLWIRPTVSSKDSLSTDFTGHSDGNYFDLLRGLSTGG